VCVPGFFFFFSLGGDVLPASDERLRLDVSLFRPFPTLTLQCIGPISLKEASLLRHLVNVWISLRLF